MNPQEFSQKIKQKYPQYKDIDDVELAQKIVTKYPQYSGTVNFSTNKEKAVEDNPYGASFRYTGEETPLEGGLKAAGNLPSSALNLVKGVKNIVTNPVQTVKGIGDVIAGGVQKVIPAHGQVGKGEEEPAFDAFVKGLKDRYGSLDALTRTAVEDPFSFGTDIVSLVGGGATLAGRGTEAAQLASRTAKLATSPVSKAVGGTADIVKSSARFGASQATGLNPETISQLIKNPSAFKNIPPELRIETANKVGQALDARLEDLSALGKNYEVVRTSPGTVIVPENTITKVLNKYGVKLSPDGKIVTSAESRPLSAADRGALEDFISNYGQEKVLSNNAFLNTREALSNLGKYEQGKTALPQQIARDLRAEYDAVGKSQIKGLKELDAQYAPERELLGQLKKDIFDSKTGDLKDGAISKIANITGKGKEKLLERMKEIVPDIDQRVKILKAVEDIENSSGLKVGTYARAGAGITGLATGNIPLIIGTILAQPEIAVPLLKGLGYTGNKLKPILEILKTTANDINNFRLPAPLLNSEGQLKAGLSIDDVSGIPKNITPQSVAKTLTETDTIAIDNFLRNPGDLDASFKVNTIIENNGLGKASPDMIKRFLTDTMDAYAGVEGKERIIVEPTKKPVKTISTSKKKR